LHDLLALAIKMLSNGSALTRDTKAKTHSTHGFVLGIACWSSNTGEDWTDRHCRYFHRLLSKETQLWSEMVTTKAILNGDKNRLLDFDAAEHPLVLQLGGSESDEMA
jgi:hypothetical protein